MDKGNEQNKSVSKDVSQETPEERKTTELPKMEGEELDMAKEVAMPTPVKTDDLEATPVEELKAVEMVDLKIVATLPEAETALRELLGLKELLSIDQLQAQGIKSTENYDKAPLLLKIGAENQYNAFMAYIEDNFSLGNKKVDNIIEEAFGILIRINAFIETYRKKSEVELVNELKKEVENDKKEV